VADVDFMRGIIYLAVQYPAEELKTEISRTAIPVPQSLALELAAHVRQHSGETLLTSPRGQLEPWRLERAIRTARSKVDGLPAGFRYHDLRHYLASLLIASGADVKTVQARLRHASARPRSTPTATCGPTGTSPRAQRWTRCCKIVRTLCGLSAQRDDCAAGQRE